MGERLLQHLPYVYQQDSSCCLLVVVFLFFFFNFSTLIKVIVRFTSCEYWIFLNTFIFKSVLNAS